MNNLNKVLKTYGALVVAIFVILTVTLGSLTLRQGEEYEDKAESARLRTISLNGQRGEITDRNGVVLATNRKSFSVKFARDVSNTSASDRAMYTQSLILAINIIEENGGKVIDDFSIKKTADGQFYFDFNTKNQSLHEERRKQWEKNFYFDSEKKPYTVEEMYSKLRSRYLIPETVDYETAHKVLSIWQEVQNNAFRSYYDIIISTDVDMVTISELETQDFYENCIEIVEGYTRVYPKGTTAAHVIGYIGKQTNEQTIKANEELGYSAGDEVGISGIESTLERQLTGNTSDKKGSRLVEVNNIGKVIREITTTEATSGDNVMLTLDYELQKKAEEALAENVKLIREEQERLYNSNKQYYDEKLSERGSTFEDLNMVEQGAVVVMDVKSGEVLTMASYPDYDANIFVGGISNEKFNQLSDDTGGAPLYNKAISGGTPGSIFKMTTAVAALMEGDITINETINDQGMFTRHLSSSTAKGPKCWTSTPSRHAAQNVTRAIQNSCNYYFYEISYRMGVDKIVKWADQLGLTSSTNIELSGEATGKVGDQSVLYDNTKPSDKQGTGMAVLVRRQIEGYLKNYLNELKITYTDTQVTNTAEKLIKLVNGKETGSLNTQIRNTLHDELDIPVATSYAKQWDSNISASLTQLIWSDNDTITTGIGQGITTVTPIAVARYVSALVNGGKVFDARLVKSTSSADGIITEKQSKLFNTVAIKEEYLTAIKQGMQNVISHEDGSSVIEYFRSWSEERRRMLAGKTGTGQVSQIDIENNAWFVAFAPYDEPEIAVVVFIPNGYAGSRAAYTVEKIVSMYLDRKEQQVTDVLENTGTVKNVE